MVPAVESVMIPKSMGFTGSQLSLDKPIILPGHMGQIKRVFKGSQKNLVIHIQDLHIDEGVQKNIADLVDYFSQKYGIKLIEMEGASGELSHGLLSRYPHKLARKLTAEYFLRQGIFSGPEYLAVAKRPDLRLVGIEEPEIYEKNRKAYLEAHEVQERDLKMIAGLRMEFQRIAATVLTGDLSKWLKKRYDFQQGTGDLFDYAEFLNEFCLKTSCGIDMPQLTRLVYSQKAQSELRLDRVSNEFNKFSEELKRLISSKAYLRFLNSWNAADSGKITKKEFSVYFKLLLQRYRLEGKYPELSVYLNFLKNFGDINQDVFLEMKDIEYFIRKTAAKDKSAGHFLDLYQDFDLLEKSFRLSLSAEDALDFFSRREKVEPLNLKDELKKLCGEFALEFRDSEDWGSLALHLPKVEYFYQMAGERDRYLAERTIREMTRSGDSVSIVLTGGFHTPSLEKYFKSKNISYAVVTPEAEKIDEKMNQRIYADAMKAESFLKHSLRPDTKNAFSDILLKDAGYQTQPPRRFPSLQNIQAVRTGITALQAASQNEKIDFLLYAMMFMGAQANRLGGISGSGYQKAISRLDLSEQRFAGLVYPIFKNTSASQSRYGLSRGYFWQPFSAEAGFGISQEWYPSEGRFRSSLHDGEFYFNTSDGWTTHLTVSESPEEAVLLKPAHQRSEMRVGEPEIRVSPMLAQEQEVFDQGILTAALQNKQISSRIFSTLMEYGGLPDGAKDVVIRIRAHSVLKDQTKVPKGAPAEDTAARVYKIMIETKQGRINFILRTEPKSWDKGLPKRFDWNLRTYSRNLNELDALFRSAQTAEGEKTTLNEILKKPVDPYSTIYVKHLNNPDEAAKHYSLSLNKPNQDEMRVWVKPAEVALLPDVVMPEAEIYQSQWNRNSYQLFTYQPKESFSPSDEAIEVPIPGDEAKLVTPLGKTKILPARKDVVSEGDDRNAELYRLLERAENNPEEFATDPESIEASGRFFDFYNDESDEVAGTSGVNSTAEKVEESVDADQPVVLNDDPFAKELAELLALQEADPVAFAVDTKNIERVMALYNQFSESRSEMRARLITSLALDVPVFLAAFLFFISSPYALLLAVAAVFAARVSFSVSLLLHEWAHLLVAAMTGHSKQALTRRNLLGGHSLKEWLKTLLPTKPLILEANVKIENVKPEYDYWIRYSGWAGSFLLTGVLALGFYWVSVFAFGPLMLAVFPGSLYVLGRTFLSDILLPNAEEGVYHCGNLGVLSSRRPTDSGILPARIQSVLQEMGAITKVRGEQAAGRVVLADNGVVMRKVVDPKRHELERYLGKKARRKQRLASMSYRAASKTYLAMEHYRYGTSSAPAEDETHPHRWMAERKVNYWVLENGLPVSKRKILANVISHNGDFDEWQLFGRDVSVDSIGLWLERVLYTANNTMGDSPKVSGMMDLLITQGMWDASVRLAYQFGVADSVEESFGGTMPPDYNRHIHGSYKSYKKMIRKQFPNGTPSQAQIYKWAAIFEKVFKKNVSTIFSDKTKDFSQGLKGVTEEMIAQFESELQKDETAGKWTAEKRRDFIKTAVKSFFENDLYTATQLFMEKAKGSFGLVTVSTLEPEKIVLSTRAQPLSIGFDPEGGQIFYASEAAALKVPLDETGRRIPYRLDMNQADGEIIELSLDHLRIYSEKLKRELTEDEMSHAGRIVKMIDNPLVDELPAAQLLKEEKRDGKKKKLSDDIVESDIRDIPKVSAAIRASWDNPESLNRQTGEEFSKMLLDSVQTPKADPEDWDLLIFGIEISQWAGEPFLADLKRIFPKLKVGTLSANKILYHAKGGKVPHVGPKTVVLTISQSGQTFGALNASIVLRQLLGDRVFAMTGELDSLLGNAVGQKYYEDAEFSKRIFLNLSGRRTAEPSSVAAVATIQTLTELLIFMARDFLKKAEAPFKPVWNAEEIEQAYKIRDAVTNDGLPSIVGANLRGDKIETPENEQLVKQGKSWGRHILEPAIVWGLAAVYVALLFWGPGPLLTYALTQLLDATWIATPYILIASKIADYLFTIFFAWFGALQLRVFQGRKLLARTGKRTLVIGDIPFVHQLLEAFASKLFSLSYGLASIEVHGSNPQDHMVHRFGHRVVRGTLVLIGRPDGRLPELKSGENAALMTAKQAKGVQNLGVGAEVVTIGHNPKKNANAEDEAVTLWRGDIAIPKSLQLFYENRFAALERLVASYVLLHAMAKKVSGFWPLRFNHSKSQSGTRIATTASPISASDISVRPIAIDEDDPTITGSEVAETVKRLRKDGGLERLDFKQELPFKIKSRISVSAVDVPEKTLTRPAVKKDKADERVDKTAVTKLMETQVEGVIKRLKTRLTDLEARVDSGEADDLSTVNAEIEEIAATRKGLVAAYAKMHFPLLGDLTRQALEVEAEFAPRILEKLIAQKKFRSELRLGTRTELLVPGLREADTLKMKAKFYKTVNFENAEHTAAQLGKELGILLASYGADSGNTAGFLPAQSGISRNQGGIIFNYRAEDHDPETLGAILRKVQSQPEINEITFIRDPLTSLEEWNALKRAFKRHSLFQQGRLTFADDGKVPDLDTLVQQRAKKLHLPMGEVLQILDPAVRVPKEREYLRANLLGAVPLGKGTIVVLGSGQPVQGVHTETIETVLENIFKHQAAIQHSA